MANEMLACKEDLLKQTDEIKSALKKRGISPQIHLKLCKLSIHPYIHVILFLHFSYTVC